MDKIYLKDIAGYAEEKQEAIKIIDIFKNYDSYKRKGIYLPKGLILYGTPGLGKTMLAKAIACESGIPFYNIDDEIDDNAELNKTTIKNLFKKAKENAPSIVFIDELDEISINRDFASDSSRDITKTLLSEMDGINNSEGVMVIATANHYNLLPPQLLRSGRMDKKIRFDLPKFEDREEICRLYLNKAESLNKISAKELAKKTQGFSGADIKVLINDTLIDCSSKNIDEITLDNFEIKIEEIKFGTIKKDDNDVQDPILYHEIGHFITKYVLNSTISMISTNKYKDVRGYVMVEDDGEDDFISRNKLLDEVTCMLGGLAAEEVILDDVTIGATDDIYKATSLIKKFTRTGLLGFDKMFPPHVESALGSPQPVISQKRIEVVEEFETELLNKALENAKNIINKNRKLIDKIYAELKQKSLLTKNQLLDIVNK